MQMRSLTEGTPWKSILSFTFPIFAGLLLQQLYNTVDSVVVGNYAGEASLAAVGACNVLTMAFLAIASGLSAGAGVLVAQLFGAGRKSEMRRQASTSLILLIGFGVICTFLGIGVSVPALQYLLNTPVQLIPAANTYFQIYCCGLIFQFGYNIVAAILRGVGNSRATLYFLLIASGVNVVLDLLFVCWMDLGVAGAALATNIAQAGCFAAAVVYMTRKYPVFRWTRRTLTFERHFAVQTLKTGFPMALQQLIVSFGFVLIQRAVNSYGQSMTASFSVAQKIETYMILPANALMTAQGTYTAQNIGAGRMDRVVKGAKQTIEMCEIASGGILIGVLVFAQPIVSIFGLGNQAAEYCTAHIQCIALCLPVFAAYFPVLGLFQGANDALYSTCVALTALAVRVASTYILQEIQQISYHMIWWNAIFGWGIGCIITWTHFRRAKWQHKSRKLEATQQEEMSSRELLSEKQPNVRSAVESVHHCDAAPVSGNSVS